MAKAKSSSVCGRSRTTDAPTVIAIGENGQVLMDIGAARMLIHRPGPYPFDPMIAALILRRHWNIAFEEPYLTKTIRALIEKYGAEEKETIE